MNWKIGQGSVFTVSTVMLDGKMPMNGFAVNVKAVNLSLWKNLLSYKG